METKVKALVDGVDQFIGIDHHKKTSYITIKDRQGEIIKRGNIDTRPDALSAFLKDGTQEEGAVRVAVLESGRTYRPMWRWLSEEVDEVVLAHPGGLKIISDTVYKDDKLDSGKLADLLMLGMIPRAHAASEEAWERRLTLRHRMMLVRMQVKVKNIMHMTVDLYPDVFPRKPEMTDMFGKQGISWLMKLQIPRDDRRRLDELLEFWEFLETKIRKSDSLVRKIVKEDERCQWLMTIPGIGYFFAALIVAEVDDINRFPSPKHFVSYIGLVPRRDKSGEVDRGGKMHKRGNRFLRWALVEAAIPATRSNLALKNKYDRISARKGRKKGRNIAKVAIANKLAWIVYAILKEERPYEIRY